MSGINLTASVRANLSSLQDVASLQTTTAAHLSTGKKVSSALDNPVNFFTAASLDSRQTQLGGLLDGISNGIQTIQAANKGLTSMTSLVQQLQSTVKQARQDTTGTVTPGTAISTTASNTATTGGKLTFTVGSQSVDIDAVSTVTSAGSPAVASTVASTAGTYPLTAGAAGNLTIQATGLNSGTAVSVAIAGTETDADAVVTKINTALNAAAGGGTATVQASQTGGVITLTNSTGSQITTGGTAATTTALGFTGAGHTTSSNGSPAVAAGTVTSTPLSVDALVTAINSNGLLAGKVTASKDASTNNLKLVNTTTSDIGVKGFSGSVLDGAVGTTSTLTAGTAALSSARQALANQFNSLVSQLDKLSTDSGFNGVNLLQGDHLKVQFNEKTGAASNSLDVSLKKSDNTDFGVLNSFNLGIGAAATTTSGAGIDFKSNTAIDTLSDTLTTALSTIQTQSSSLGANLSVVQTRQDFTKQIIDVLKTGSGNLTDADMNEEAANSQALSTRQSIGISALSLANTANQGILQLLR